MPYASSDDARVYYEVHGTGPAVVLTHGAGGHHAIWWQQIPYFRDRYTVVALDLPGFGKSSDRDGRDTLRFPADILAVLDDAGIGKAVLVGQSLGSPPSLRLAVDHPERVAGVVLSHSTAGISDQEIHALTLADRAEAVQLPVLDRLMSKRAQQTEPAKVFLFQQLGTFNAVTVPDLRNTLAPVTSLEEVRKAVAAGVYVSFLAGDDDAVVRPATYRRLRELLPEAHYEIVPGAPHSMYWESPELFNTVLDRILDDIRKASPAGW